MSFHYKKYLILGLVASLIIIVTGFLAYRHYFRPEEWRLYKQIKSKPVWVEWIGVKTDWFDFESDKIDRKTAFEKLWTLGKKAGPPLVALLRDRDENVRYEASRAIYYYCSNSEVTELIIGLLQDKNQHSDTREIAARTLSDMLKHNYDKLHSKIQKRRSSGVATWEDMHGTRALRVLINCIRDKSPEIVLISLSSLRGYDYENIDDICFKFDLESYLDRENEKFLLDESSEGLIAYLSDEDPGIRSRATESLFHIGDQEAVEPLIRCLLDKDNKVRYSAALSLGRLGDQRVLKPLIGCLGDEDDRVREVAAISLELVGYKTDQSSRVREEVRACIRESLKPILSFLSNEDEEIREEATSLLSFNFRNSILVEPLSSFLEDSNNPPKARCIALGVLVDILEEPYRNLHSDISHVRSLAVSTWESLDGTRALKVLIKSLRDESPKLRVAITEALVTFFSHINDIDDICGKFELDSTWNDKKQGSYSSKSIDSLIAFLSNKYPGIRSQAAHDLYHLGNQQAIEPLIKCLRDQDDRVRCSVAMSLGRLGDQRALKPLYECLSNENGRLKELVTRSLKALKYKTDASSRTRTSVYSCLGESLKTLMMFLSDKNSDVRLSAVNALASLGDVQAIDPIIKCLQDKNGGVRLSAANALASFGDSRAIDPLIKCLHDKDEGVRCAVVFALASLKDSRAIDPLIKYLQHKDNDVRYKATQALRSFKYNPQAFITLLKCLWHDDSGIQYSARWDFDFNQDGVWIETLKKALLTENLDFRQSLKKALRKATQDKDNDVRKMAGKVLEKLDVLL